jgi:hypothetical protein
MLHCASFLSITHPGWSRGEWDGAHRGGTIVDRLPHAHTCGAQPAGMPVEGGSPKVRMTSPMDGTAPCRRRITSATIPVHPVWCAAPRPAALSPWKYSLNTRLSFQFGSSWNRSTHPKQGRRPSGPTNNGMDPGSTSARTVLGLLRYVDRDLNDPAAYEAMETPPVRLARDQPRSKQQDSHDDVAGCHDSTHGPRQPPYSATRSSAAVGPHEPGS